MVNNLSAPQTLGQLSEKELRDIRRMRAVREALDELKRKGIDADIVICPVCKSHRLVQLTSFPDLGYIGSFQPAYYCLECGWFGRFNVTMSNRELEEAVLKDMSDAHPELLEEKQEDDEEIYDIE
ncbi:MAG: hypothetical protein KAR33_06800 [Candidatus Thorarchaeota archaeon]|nr:hypothetical protein [Candidatus Thorarchaeota archaeon]